MPRDIGRPDGFQVGKYLALETEERARSEKNVVPKAGFEPAHPGGRQTLNRLQFIARWCSLWYSVALITGFEGRSCTVYHVRKHQETAAT